MSNEESNILSASGPEEGESVKKEESKISEPLSIKNVNELLDYSDTYSDSDFENDQQAKNDAKLEENKPDTKAEENKDASDFDSSHNEEPKTTTHEEEKTEQSDSPSKHGEMENEEKVEEKVLEREIPREDEKTTEQSPPENAENGEVDDREQKSKDASDNQGFESLKGEIINRIAPISKEEEDKKEEVLKEENIADKEIEENNDIKVEDDTAAQQLDENQQDENKQNPESQNEKEQEQQKEEEDTRDPAERELEEALDAVVNRFTPPPAHLRVPMKQMINRKRVEAIVAGDYETAEQMDRNNRALNYALALEQKKANEDNRMDILYNRYQQLQQEQQRFNESWDAKINSFLEADDQRLEKLKQTHEQEKEDFSKKWRDPQHLLQFNKPSSRLLHLREMEKARAVSRLYDKAKEMKVVADKLQKEETAAAQRRIEEQMDLDRRKMEERHERELKRHQEHRETALMNLEKEREMSMRHIVNAIAQIKAKKGTVGSSKPSSVTVTRDLADADKSPLSPRTQKIYQSFRSEKQRTRLEVQPIEERPQTMNGRRAPARGRPKTAIKRPVTATSRSRFNPRK